MPYLSEAQIAKIGFKRYGKNLQISDRATFYRPERISLGSHIKIDDFAVLANAISLENHIHIALGATLLANENAPITIESFAALAYRAMIITSSDDYSGEFMTNPTLPERYRGCYFKSVNVARHAIIGAGAMVLPGCDIAEGVSVGAMSLVTRKLKAWGIYCGIPARRINERSRELLKLEAQFLKEEGK